MVGKVYLATNITSAKTREYRERLPECFLVARIVKFEVLIDKANSLRRPQQRRHRMSKPCSNTRDLPVARRRHQSMCFVRILGSDNKRQTLWIFFQR